MEEGEREEWRRRRRREIDGMVGEGEKGKGKEEGGTKRGSEEDIKVIFFVTPCSKCGQPSWS